MENNDKSLSEKDKMVIATKLGSRVGYAKKMY